MAYIIYGAGGVGGTIGAEFFKAGFDVTLIARGEHLSALQKHGLRYRTPHEDKTLQIPAVGCPSEVEITPSDVVFLTMKSQHTLEALDRLRACHGDNVAVVCCQNSVNNELEALRRFARVYAMLVYLPGQLLEPGVIDCHAALKPGVLDLVRFPGQVDGVAESIASDLRAANFSSVASTSTLRLKYAKLLMNLNNAVEAVVPAGEDAQRLRDLAKAEGRACLEAAGIDYASSDEVSARREGVFAAGDIPGVARVGGSSRQSLLRGTGDIESDFLNGEIVLLGRLHNVPTPVNTVLQRYAVRLAAAKAPPGSVGADEIWGAVEAERTANQ